MGLTGLLVSPVSWIHHAIWIVPATGVLLGSGRTRAQWGRWGVVFALFLLRTPQWVEAGWLPAGPISDSALDMKALERALGPMTVRTRGTVEQIAARHFGA